MSHRVGRTWIAVLAATLASCALFAGSYKLEIRSPGSMVSRLHSLYVIVSRSEDVVEPLLSKSEYKELLSDSRVSNYTAFAQFQPDPANNTWKKILQGNPSEYVSFTIQRDLIKVRVKHQLIDRSGGREFSLVVLAQLANGEFEQVKAGHASLNDNAKQIVLVSGGSLQLLNK